MYGPNLWEDWESAGQEDFTYLSRVVRFVCRTREITTSSEAGFLGSPYRVMFRALDPGVHRERSAPSTHLCGADRPPRSAPSERSRREREYIAPPYYTFRAE